MTIIYCTRELKHAETPRYTDLSTAHLYAHHSQICKTSPVKQIQCRITEEEHSGTSTKFEEGTDVATSQVTCVLRNVLLDVRRERSVALAYGQATLQQAGFVSLMAYVTML
jgi:hypothetical protein